MALSTTPRPVFPMLHPYSGPASMECVNDTLTPLAQRRTQKPVCNFSLPSGFCSSGYGPGTIPSTSTSIISSSLGEPVLPSIIEESSFFFDPEHDSEARRSARRSGSVRSRRLKKRAPRPPPPSIRSARSRSSEDPHSPVSPKSERSARSEVSGMSFSANTYRSGWTSSLCSDDTFDYLNDPYLPYWRLVIRAPIWALVVATSYQSEFGLPLMCPLTKTSDQQNLPSTVIIYDMVSQRRSRAKKKEEVVESDEQVKTRAAHTVLFNQELLSAILGLLRESSPGRRRSTLHPFLFVNKSFFQTTADWLWKDMHSFMPFIRSFLPLVGEMPSPEALDSMVDGSLWERFLLYSSRTASLTISSETASHGYWISFLLGQQSRPKVLFPKLRTLTLESPDIAAITILSAAAPLLSTCNISRSENANFVKTAIAALTLNCKHLSTFTAAVNLPEGTMSYLARIRGLENVVLGGVDLQKQFTELSSIGNIPGLKTLALGHSQYAEYRSPGHQLLPSYSPAVDDVLDAETQAPHLEKLLACGDGLTHHKIARGIALPTTLRQLDLIVWASTPRLLLFPNVLRLYLERNPMLQRFRVKFYDKDDYSHFGPTENMRDFQDKPLYQDSAAFLPALSRAQFLTEIKIEGVKFLDSKLLLKLSELLPSFPALKRVTLRLRDFFHSRTTDVPPLSILETLSTSCPHLEWFNVPLGWEGIPTLPLSSPSHRLRRMFILGGKAINLVSFQEKIAVARYLMTLFPYLEGLADSSYECLEDAGGWLSSELSAHSFLSAMDEPSHRYAYTEREKMFWSDMEGLVLSYQDTRRQAIAEASRALPYHDA